MDILLTSTFVPQSADQLTHAYLIWTAIFLAVNIIWDVLTDVTPPFTFHRLASKGTVLMGATSFCSSLLVLGALVNDQTEVVVGGTPVPLLIAGGVGVLLSLIVMCPYNEKEAEEARQKKMPQQGPQLPAE